MTATETSTIVPPSPGFVVRSAEFERAIGPDPRIVAVLATDAHEGPVYPADEDALYFTSIPRRSSDLDLTLPLVSIRGWRSTDAASRSSRSASRRCARPPTSPTA